MIKVPGSMPSRHIRRHVAGMSLLEILVATLIFTIIVLGFTGLFKYSLQAWVTIVGRFQNTQNIGGALDIIGTELRTALPPYETNGGVNLLGYDEAGSPSMTLTNSVSDEIQFHLPTYSSSEGDGGTTSADRDEQVGSEVVKRGYWLRRDLTNDSRVQQGRDVATIGSGSVAATDAYMPTIPQGFSIQDEFAHSVAKFNIDYYDGTSWVNEWDAAAENELPKLIRIKMTSIKAGVTTTMVSVIHPRARGAYITQ